jgi:hypothetical protein
MERGIVEFKSRSVQRPQRLKVAVRRDLEDQIKSLRAIEKVANRAVHAEGAGSLPVSEPARTLRKTVGLKERVEALEASVVVDERFGADELRYRLDLSADGTRVEAAVSHGLLEPTVIVGGHRYQVQYAEGGPDGPPVIIRNRPRRIIFNTGHPAHDQGERARKYSFSLALELAYLQDREDAAGMYERMMHFLEVL